MNFSKRLKKIREDAHLSQKEVAEKIGLSAQAYNNYEKRGYSPTPELLVKLAIALKTTPNDLLDFRPKDLSDLEYAEKNIPRWDFVMYKTFAKYPICGEDGNTTYVKIPIKKFSAMCSIAREEVEISIECQSEVIRPVLFLRELDKEVYNYMNSKEEQENNISALDAPTPETDNK